MHSGSGCYVFSPGRAGRAPESDNEASAGRRSSTFRADRAAHGLNHGSRDVETNADPTLVVDAAVDLLALRERFEDPREVRRQPDALVLDGELDPPRHPPRAHDDRTPGGGVLDGVVDELVEGLGKGLAVTEDGHLVRHVDTERVQ